MTIFIVAATILLLILLITVGKVNAFLAFLITSIFASILLGIPMDQIPGVIKTGMGNMLGSLAIIVCIGAMFGKLISDSGAAQKIAMVLTKIFGLNYIHWALLLTGFIVGIPLFYNVGFVILVPLLFSIVYKYKLPAVYLGIPMLAALSVTHGFLPPHPSPVALVELFNADLGTTLVYGIFCAIPAMVIAGPIFSSTLKNIKSTPLDIFKPEEIDEKDLPSTVNSFLTALLPVVLLIGTTIIPLLNVKDEGTIQFLSFIKSEIIVMIIALTIATFTLGVFRKTPIKKIMSGYGDSVKDIAMILLIVAGAGVLKQVFKTSGADLEIANLFKNLNINPLLLGFLMATIIRVCLGSATVAGLTAAGIMAPIVVSTGASPELMILAIGAGSLMLSHVNDSGFWMYKEYFNLSLKDTFRSWSVMETIVGLVGIVMVLILDTFIA